MAYFIISFAQQCSFLQLNHQVYHGLALSYYLQDLLNHYFSVILSSFIQIDFLNSIYQLALVVKFYHFNDHFIMAIENLLALVSIKYLLEHLLSHFGHLLLPCCLSKHILDFIAFQFIEPMILIFHLIVVIIVNFLFYPSRSPLVLVIIIVKFVVLLFILHFLVVQHLLRHVLPYQDFILYQCIQVILFITFLRQSRIFMQIQIISLLIQFVFILLFLIPIIFFVFHHCIHQLSHFVLLLLSHVRLLLPNFLHFWLNYYQLTLYIIVGSMKVNFNIIFGRFAVYFISFILRDFNFFTRFDIIDQVNSLGVILYLLQLLIFFAIIVNHFLIVHQFLELVILQFSLICSHQLHSKPILSADSRIFTIKSALILSLNLLIHRLKGWFIRNCSLQVRTLTKAIREFYGMKVRYWLQDQAKEYDEEVMDDYVRSGAPHDALLMTPSPSWVHLIFLQFLI